MKTDPQLTVSRRGKSPLVLTLVLTFLPKFWQTHLSSIPPPFQHFSGKHPIPATKIITSIPNCIQIYITSTHQSESTMPPLDLLDSVTSGHMPNPSPERRDPAPTTLDGPRDGYPSPHNAAPVETHYSPPPTPSSPPAYRPPPHRHPFFRRNGIKPLWHWLRLVYLDILFMLAALAVTYIIQRFSHVAFHTNQRYFPMTWDPISRRWYGPSELSYPYTPLLVPSMFAGIMLPGVGFTVIVVMQVWVRSFWDANAGLFGLLKGLIMM